MENRYNQAGKKPGDEKVFDGTLFLWGVYATTYLHGDQ
jgi:hypothetical protein